MQNFGAKNFGFDPQVDISALLVLFLKTDIPKFEKNAALGPMGPMGPGAGSGRRAGRHIPGLFPLRGLAYFPRDGSEMAYSRNVQKIPQNIFLCNLFSSLCNIYIILLFKLNT